MDDMERARRIQHHIYGPEHEAPFDDRVVAVVLVIVGAVLILGLGALYGVWRWLR